MALNGRWTHSMMSSWPAVSLSFPTCTPVLFKGMDRERPVPVPRAFVLWGKGIMHTMALKVTQPG